MIARKKTHQFLPGMKIAVLRNINSIVGFDLSNPWMTRPSQGLINQAVKHLQ
jgi:hypothetical protein